MTHPDYLPAARALSANPPPMSVEEWGVILETLEAGTIPADSSNESKELARVTRALFAKLMETEGVKP